MLQAQRVVYLRLRPFAFFLPAPSFASNCCWVRKVSIDLARSSRSALHIHGTSVRQTDTKIVASRGIVALFAVQLVSQLSVSMVLWAVHLTSAS